MPSQALKVSCQILCTLLALLHGGVVVRVLFCLMFPCPVLGQHIFSGIRLLLNLNQEESDIQLVGFYSYLIGIHLFTTFITGIAASGIILDLVLLLVVNLTCFVNLLSSSAYLILLMYIGIDEDKMMKDTAIFLGFMVCLELATLSLTVALYASLLREYRALKASLHTAKLITNKHQETPLLVP